MILLGLVGSIAAGKSTVASRLSESGALWIDADLIAREMIQRPEVVRQLVARFGDRILERSEVINRAVLADLVFGDDSSTRSNLEYLESIVHPLTRQEITSRLEMAARQNVPVAILDIPLLFRSGWDKCCDVIWCIDAPLAVRRGRAKKRGWDENELSSRESNQTPTALKSHLSNMVVQNDGTLNSLFQKIDEAWRNLVTMEELIQEGQHAHCVTDFKMLLSDS